MRPNSRSALVVGSSGLVGGFCLQFLLDDVSYNKVIVLVRKRVPLKHAKLEQHVIDFGQLNNFSHLIKSDDVFCCLGTTTKRAGSQAEYEKVDYTYPFELAKIASTNGTGQFLIVTSIGADPASSFFYLRTKGRIEEAINSLSFRTVYIFRPSMLVGRREEFRWQDYLVPPLLKIAALGMVGRWRKYRAIEGKAVAYSMVESAKMNLEGIHVYESDQIQSMYDQGIR